MRNQRPNPDNGPQTMRFRKKAVFRVGVGFGEFVCLGACRFLRPVVQGLEQCQKLLALDVGLRRAGIGVGPSLPLRLGMSAEAKTYRASRQLALSSGASSHAC